MSPVRYGSCTSKCERGVWKSEWRSPGEVLLICWVCFSLAQATLMLNEVFDIDLSLDSWWFLPDKAMPKKIRDVPKQLLFNAPVRGRWV